MPRLRRRDGERDRLQVAHLAYHNHVRIFAQCPAQGRAEGARVRKHFALRNVAIFRLENVFDRVLKRDDMLAPLHIYLLDHRRQRRRFATANRTCH